MVLFPAGYPKDSVVVDDRPLKKSYEEEEELDRQAVMESARDFYIMSLVNIHILTRKSGFGIVGAMTSLTDKHIVYRIALDGVMRNCSDDLDGDDLSVFANDWSEL
jgi:hypothetical protein